MSFVLVIFVFDLADGILHMKPMLKRYKRRGNKKFYSLKKKKSCTPHR